MRRKNNFEKRLFPENPELTPYVVIERFENALGIYGEELVRTDRRFQKAREMYTTAILLLGRNKLTGEEHWIAPCYDEVPDVYAYKFQPHPDFPDSQQKVQMNIEVTEWNGHSTESLHERIINKLKGKAYPAYFVLFVHIKKTGGVDLDAEYDAIQKYGIPLMEAWATGSVVHEDPSRQVTISIGPSKIGLEFSLKEAVMENKNQTPGALVVELRKRGNDTLIYPELYKFEFPPLE